MIEKSSAIELVSEKLKEMAPFGEVWVVIPEKTIEKPYGWVLFYNTKEFVETGDFIHRLAGNGPVIVEKTSGKIKFFGSGESLESISALYGDF
jgi:hypothetical protein